MQRLVEGCEGDFHMIEHCDDNPGENEDSSAGESKKKTQPDNPALEPSRHSTEPRNAAHADRIGEERNQIIGNQGRSGGNLRIARNRFQLSTFSMIYVFILLVFLISVVSLGLAIFTTLKVAKLKDVPWLSSCPKGR